jgi:hypothetical protein
MTNEQVKEKALEFLKDHIRVSEWRNTSMGSGYEFQLKNPFRQGDLYSMLASDSTLIERLFLDEYGGVGEEDEPFLSAEEMEQHFKDHQQSVWNWGYNTILEEGIKKYLYKFEEFVLQAIEASQDY